MDDAPGFVDNWLRLNVPDFRNDKTFAALVQNNNGQRLVRLYLNLPH